MIILLFSDVFGESNGFSSGVIQGILEDSKGYLWLSTNRGINRFDPKYIQVKVFSVSHGLQDEEFYSGAYHKSEKGELFFGGGNGFNIINPNSICENTYTPHIEITDFKILNESVEVSQNGILTKVISETDEIVLDFSNSKVLTFEFALLEFSNPQKNEYSYIMEGFDNKWNYIGSRRFATYTNLSPGEYTFKVMGVNSYGVWNSDGRAISIIVKPPFYRTTWFFILTVFLFISLLIFIIKYRTKKIRDYNVLLQKEVAKRTKELQIQNKEILVQKNKLEEQAYQIENTNIELEQLNSELETRVEERTKQLLEAKNLAENADKLKSEFLAQMSHEIRQPINVILSYANLLEISFEDILDDDTTESIHGMNRAGKRIIRTIDLILNMSELQTNSYEYILSEVNLSYEINNLVKYEFKVIAEKKGLKLLLNNNLENSFINADQYSINQIFANIIDNAIKYTEKGKVVITIDENEKGKFVEISDSGIGISEEYLPNLFSPFRQEEQGYTRKFEGNGLGMSLVKRYCELNKATITVKSKKGSGTTFRILFSK